MFNIVLRLEDQFPCLTISSGHFIPVCQQEWAPCYSLYGCLCTEANITNCASLTNNLFTTTENKTGTEHIT